MLAAMTDPRLDDLAAHLSALPPIAVLYTDLDGTLLGPGGALLSAPDGRPSLRAAAALVRAREAGITVVPVSGRRASSLAADARLMGLADAIAEVGTVILRAGTITYNWGECPRRVADTPRAALGAAGAPQALLRSFGGSLRPYDPWDAGRQGGYLLHGTVDVAEAAAVLRRAGCGWAHLVDNGSGGEWDSRTVHAYHLIARGVGKAIAIADDLHARGLQRGQAVAIGDSPEDRTMADAVGTYVQVANGRGQRGDDLFVVPGAMGDGFADAVAAITQAHS